MKAEKKPHLIILASFPPPFAGQSIATRILTDGLEHSPECPWALDKLDFSESLGGDSMPRRAKKILSLCWKLFFLCVSEDVRLVYLQLGHGKFSIVRDTFFLSIAKLCHCPTLLHVHGSGYRKALDDMPSLIQKAARKLASQARGAIVLSPCLREMFHNILDECRIFVVENGIDIDIEQAAKQFSREYSEPTSDRPLRILYLSNLVPAKGYGTLLEAARRSERNGLQVEFIFAGVKIPNADPDIDAFIETHHLTKTRYVGSVGGEARLNCYREADVFVLPSEYEGQPLCILEAMHFGLPVISTDVGGIPDIFADHDGAILTKPNDADALYQAIETLYQSRERREAMGRANRESACQTYNAAIHLKRMLEILKDCAK